MNKTRSEKAKEILSSLKLKPAPNPNIEHCLEYKRGKRLLKFFSHVRDNYNGIVSIDPKKERLAIAYSVPQIYIIVLDKENEQQRINLGFPHARLLYDYFDEPVPTEVLKYFT